MQVLEQEEEKEEEEEEQFVEGDDEEDSEAEVRSESLHCAAFDHEAWAACVQNSTLRSPVTVDHEA